MSKKPAAGYVLDVSAVAGPIRSLDRNPWPAAAHYFNGTQTALCASGQWVAYASFTMDDGTDRYFPYAYDMTQAGAAALLYGWPGFCDLDSEETYLGTYALGAIYHSPFDSILAADLTAWLAAH
jgi:hypothetical protein